MLGRVFGTAAKRKSPDKARAGSSPADGGVGGDPASKAEPSLFMQAVATYSYVFVWIALSGTVIMYNKWILAYYGFPYPISLTLWHMVFSSVLAFLLVRLGYVGGVDMSTDTYLRAIVPIGACFAGTLWLGNAAYLYLSVSFIQMLKALMPVAVFMVGCSMGTEKYSRNTFANMVLVSIGVCIASYGEINFVVIGVVLQLASVCMESTRLTLVQILLQRRGLTLNPITTMYYIAPCSALFLLVPFAFIELPQLLKHDGLRLNATVFVTNAISAFALNMSVFLLIGKTSALTMNIAGVVKDWLLIGLSVWIYNSAITATNLGGYAVAFGGVCWYNYQKIQAKLKQQQDAAVLAAKAADAERAPLLNGHLANGTPTTSPAKLVAAE